MRHFNYATWIAFLFQTMVILAACKNSGKKSTEAPTATTEEEFDNLLPVTTNVAMDNKLFFLKKDTAIIDSALSILPEDEPVLIKAYTPQKGIQDTIILCLLYPTSPRQLADSIQQLSNFAQSRVRMLKKMQPPSGSKLLAWILFADQCRSRYGYTFNIFWDIEDEYLFDNSVQDPQPSPFSAEFNKKLLNLELNKNQILHFPQDSVIVINTTVKNSQKYRNRGLTLGEHKEAIRLVYELLGNDISKYNYIAQIFIDQKFNQVMYPLLSFQDRGLDKNPKAMIPLYLQLFPERKSKCLLCN